jgi:hypothetical protein
MKVRFHGQLEWHLPRPAGEGEPPATLCGISLADANTFNYTFRKVGEPELCPRCASLGSRDDTDPRIAMDRG